MFGGDQVSMCWCKDCKWLDEYLGVCTNDESVNCYDMPDGHNSCEHSEPKVKECDYCKGILKSTKASPRRNYIYCPMCGIKREKENDNE